MGLDYSIELNITNKKTKMGDCYEIAYWRKHYSIRSETMRCIQESEAFVEQDDDFRIVATIDAIPILIDFLGKSLADRESDLFTNSLWDHRTARLITVRQLMRMCAWDSLLCEIENIKTIIEPEIRVEAIDEILGDILEELDSYEDKPISDSLKNYLIHAEDYDFTIEIINSY